MFIEQFEVKGLAHYSYAVGCGEKKVMAVVDPKRDVDTYVEFAAARGLKITHVLETHIHADYASGAKELSDQTGAELCVSAYDGGEMYEAQFSHRDLRDGDQIEIGRVRLRVRHTPGHTPEHVAFLVYGGSGELASAAGSAGDGGGDRPAAIFSGDFLFVGSLGRPDLLGDEAKHALAGRLFDSVRSLADLPDSLVIYPAHGAGSMCGAGMANQPSSTLGAERLANPYLDAKLTRDAFVAKVLGSTPPFPSYYRRMKRLNSSGPPPFGSRPKPEALDGATFRRLWEGGHVVIDVRGELPFGRGHVPGAFGIGRGNLLSTWAAWVVPYDTPLLLVTADGADGGAAGIVDEVTRCLARVGLDDVRGWLGGGFTSWGDAGYPVRETPQLSPVELQSRLTSGDVRLIDVRGDGEYAAGHVPGAEHIMGGVLADRADALRERGGEFAVMCGGGYRSTVAASVLERAGVERVYNVTGGMRAWTNAGLPTST